MSFTAVRNLTVVSLIVLAGLLISGSIYAETARYQSDQYSSVINIWGTTYDDKDGNFNQGHYFAEWSGYPGPGNPNRDYGEMPQEDTNTISKIDAPFDMSSTSWSATPADIAQTYPRFQTFDSSCNPNNLAGSIYAMNDTDHIYLALELEADKINAADRLFLYFDPDNIQPVAEFVDGSGYCVGVKLGDITQTLGSNPTVNQEMAFCNGHWMDWNNSGSVDTWEAAWPWPYIGTDHGVALTATQANYHQLEKDTGNKEDLTVCPRSASEWGDGGTVYPYSGAYWEDAASTGGPNGWVAFRKLDVIQMQFKIPIEYLGCSLPLGSNIGFAIQWFDDGGPAYNGVIDRDCSDEAAWMPQDIERSGPPGSSEWEKYDATYMGVMTLSSLNIGNRLWGAWFDVKSDRTSYCVLKNVSDETVTTKVNFYESAHGDASERYAPMPGAGELLLATQCLEIDPHGVVPIQLETVAGGVLVNKKGSIEVTNTDLAGYEVAFVGLDSGALQKYAWSTDLEMTPYTPRDWSDAHGGVITTGMMLANKWYIVGETGWDYNTSIVILNPSSTNSVKASLVVYPFAYWNPTAMGEKSLCADGFHPDFDNDYDYNGTTRTSKCGDITGDTGDVINLPPHQAVEIRMWEFLNLWVAPWPDLGSAIADITDNTNAYYHFRKGTVEISVQDGDDAYSSPDTAENRLDESLLGITARESANQGWGEALQRYYE